MDSADITAKRKAVLRSHFKPIWLRISYWLGSLFYGAAVVLIAMAGWATYFSVAHSGWGSEAAAWVQAAGSIAAIVGATWLAQSEGRRARRNRREQNEEAAWYVRFAIVQAQFDSHTIAADLVNRTTPVEGSDIRDWRQRATVSALGLGAFVDRTDHIHPSVTHVISNAKVLVDDLVDDLRRLGALVEDGRKPDDELIGQIVAPHRALLEIIDLYDARMRGVREVLDEGGDALPIQKWSPWDKDSKEVHPKSARSGKADTA
ncbi:hypothetical protein MesoLj113a_32790 [Mesorhizobium sp. 113-1-2]|uniref:hypothetical protein n=1 Tax=Mesorhizobium sp. 113-1-2 TaxID=2744515 RepID=UPI00192598B2|nr:hypothetical protein [Mesorhizobium sp. 113-1-2]BCG72121.1 hypothetical protein MesoLj113a_32790 [Mesorhizobium sp. 113-1-2]